jgi:hypothetical protein
MAVEEAAAKEGVAPKTVWRNVAKLARSLAVHRQGLWAWSWPPRLSSRGIVTGSFLQKICSPRYRESLRSVRGWM